MGCEHARGTSRLPLKFSATRDFAFQPKKLRDGLSGNYAWSNDGGLVLGKGNHGRFNSVEAGATIEN